MPKLVNFGHLNWHNIMIIVIICDNWLEIKTMPSKIVCNNMIHIIAMHDKRGLGLPGC